MHIGAKRAAIADATEAPQLIAAAHRQQRPLRIARTLRRDVDDTVDCVGAPERRARTADYLNPVDVFQQRVLHIPEDSGEERCVDSSPVDQYLQLVRDGAVEATRA